MQVNTNSMSALLIFCLVFLFVPANAQYVLKHSVFSNGGGVSSEVANYNLRSTAGQGLIGKTSNISYSTNSGFWYQSSFIYTAIENPFTELPTNFQLYQNYPNPFNPNTNIKFALPKVAEVKIDVFNLLGQHVATVLNAKKQAGFHLVNFNANSLASGVYFYTISANDFCMVKRMLLVK